MSEHGILKYFYPILDKKDPPEDKGYIIHLGNYRPLLSIASCNAEVTKVLKQAKWYVTKNRYL